MGKKCEINAQIDAKFLRYGLISHFLPNIQIYQLPQVTFLKQYYCFKIKKHTVIPSIKKMGTFWAYRLSTQLTNNVDNINRIGQLLVKVNAYGIYLKCIGCDVELVQ